MASPSISTYGPYALVDGRDPVPAPDGLLKLLGGEACVAQPAETVPGEPTDVTTLPADLLALLAER